MEAHGSGKRELASADGYINRHCVSDGLSHNLYNIALWRRHVLVIFDGPRSEDFDAYLYVYEHATPLDDILSMELQRYEHRGLTSDPNGSIVTLYKVGPPIGYDIRVSRDSSIWWMRARLHTDPPHTIFSPRHRR